MKNRIIAWLIGDAALRGLGYAIAVVDVVQDALQGVIDGDNTLDGIESPMKQALAALASLSAFLRGLAELVGATPIDPMIARRLMDDTEITARLTEYAGKL